MFTTTPFLNPSFLTIRQMEFRTSLLTTNSNSWSDLPWSRIFRFLTRSSAAMWIRNWSAWVRRTACPTIKLPSSPRVFIYLPRYSQKTLSQFRALQQISPTVYSLSRRCWDSNSSKSQLPLLCCSMCLSSRIVRPWLKALCNW